MNLDLTPRLRAGRRWASVIGPAHPDDEVTR